VVQRRKGIQPGMIVSNAGMNNDLFGAAHAGMNQASMDTKSGLR
jgi:hypothetical protein